MRLLCVAGLALAGCRDCVEVPLTVHAPSVVSVYVLPGGSSEGRDDLGFAPLTRARGVCVGDTVELIGSGARVLVPIEAGARAEARVLHYSVWPPRP